MIRLGMIRLRSPSGAEMLDGNHYYAAFPDENPKARSRLQDLLDALAALQRQFSRHIEAVRIETSGPKETKPPGA
jgi:hypothetical protein